ncbi:MAG TPA: STAS domain-containing protein [Tepidisphaeraceae bacterium]|nr:STAS domain-containing protein [Tepidisphaeraceae bacterium]
MSTLLVERANHWLVLSFRAAQLIDPRVVHTTFEDLLDQLDELPFRAQVVLDFRRVEHASSQVIGMLVGVKREMDRKHGTLVLTRVCPQIRELLVVTKLESQFTFAGRLRDVLSKDQPPSSFQKSELRTDDPVWIDSIV